MKQLFQISLTSCCLFSITLMYGNLDMPNNYWGYWHYYPWESQTHNSVESCEEAPTNSKSVLVPEESKKNKKISNHDSEICIVCLQECETRTKRKVCKDCKKLFLVIMHRDSK